MGCIMVSPAKLKANEKYIKEKTDDIKYRPPKGFRAVLQDFAQKQGKSVNAFIHEAVLEKMEREKEP